MNALLYFIHLYSSLFLGGAIVLGMSAHFKAGWSEGVQRSLPLWQKLSWGWAALILILLGVRESYFQFSAYQGHKAIYFGPAFLMGRNIFYAACAFIGLQRLKQFPPLFLFLFFIIGNLFAFDWGMSLEKTWFSNMYGLIYLGIGASSAMALFMLLNMADLPEKIKVDFTHLLLVLCLFGLYFHFSQFIIMWMGNIPREVIFYTKRMERFGLWPLLFILAVKYFPIMSVSFLKNKKTHAMTMKFVSGSVLLGSMVELLWLVNL